MVRLEKAVGVILVTAFFMIPMIRAASTNGSAECQPDFYRDHGTGHCEHCCDICCKAEKKKTEAECQKQCPAYAKRLADERKIDPIFNPLPQQGNEPEKTQSPTSTSLPTGEIVGIAVSVVAAGALIAFLAVFILHKHQQGRHREDSIELEEVATPLNPADPPTRGVQPHENDDQPPSDLPGDRRLMSSAAGPRIAQETAAGQEGDFELALNGSRLNAVNDEVVPKVLGLPRSSFCPSGAALLTSTAMNDEVVPKVLELPRTGFCPTGAALPTSHV